MRIVIITSGMGGDFLALLKAKKAGVLQNIDFCLLISTISNSTSLIKARENKIPIQVIHVQKNNRKEANHQINELLLKIPPDLICLCGYQYLLDKNIVSLYSGRIINSHPSLLPSFPGIIKKETLLGSNIKILGATVHFVDENIDSGTQIIQAAFPNPGLQDLPSTLKLYRKIQDALYVQAVKWFEISLRSVNVFKSLLNESFFYNGILFVPPIDEDVKRIILDNNKHM